MNVPPGEYLCLGKPITPDEIKKLGFYERAKVQREITDEYGDTFRIRP